MRTTKVKQRVSSLRGGLGFGPGRPGLHCKAGLPTACQAQQLVERSFALAAVSEKLRKSNGSGHLQLMALGSSALMP